MPRSSSTTARSLLTSSASARSFSPSILRSSALQRSTEWAIAGTPKRKLLRAPMKKPRIPLGIRAQLLLVLTVFFAIPWLGYEYVRELERFLRDAQERTLAGTAQAVATALHARPRLFEPRSIPKDSLGSERRGGRGGAS